MILLLFQFTEIGATKSLVERAPENSGDQKTTSAGLELFSFSPIYDIECASQSQMAATLSQASRPRITASVMTGKPFLPPHISLLLSFPPSKDQHKRLPHLVPWRDWRDWRRLRPLTRERRPTRICFLRTILSLASYQKRRTQLSAENGCWRTRGLDDGLHLRIRRSSCCVFFASFSTHSFQRSPY